MAQSDAVRVILVGSDPDVSQWPFITTCQSGIPMDQCRKLFPRYPDDGDKVVGFDAGYNKLASITKNGALHVHSVFDRDPILSIQVNSPARCVAISPSTTRFICTGSESFQVHVWSSLNGQSVAVFSGHNGPVSIIAINHDDSYIASYSNDQIIIHSLIHSNNVATYNHKSVTSLTFSPLSKFLLCATDDHGNVVIYDVKSKAPSVSFLNAHSAPATGAAFSPTNKVFFATCSLNRCVAFFDLAAKIKISTSIEAEAPIKAIQFVPNGMSIIIADTSGDTLVYDLRSTATPTMRFRGSFPKLLPYVSLPVHQSTNPSMPFPIPSSVHVSTALFSPVQTTAYSSAKSHSRPIQYKASPSTTDQALNSVSVSSSLFSPVRSTLRSVSIASSSTSIGSFNDRSSVSMSEEKLISLSQPLNPGLTTSRKTETLSEGTVESSASELTISPEILRLNRNDREEPREILVDAKPEIASRSPVDRSTRKLDPDRVIERSEDPHTDSRTSLPETSASTPPATSVPEPVAAPTIPGEPTQSGNPMLMEVIRSAFEEVICGLRNDVRNLHLDVIRQFHEQKLELAAQFAAEHDSLRNQLSTALSENQDLRRRIDQLGPFSETERSI